jgi:hypothetical protein
MRILRHRPIDRFRGGGVTVAEPINAQTEAAKGTVVVRRFEPDIPYEFAIFHPSDRPLSILASLCPPAKANIRSPQFPLSMFLLNARIAPRHPAEAPPEQLVRLRVRPAVAAGDEEHDDPSSVFLAKSSADR